MVLILETAYLDFLSGEGDSETRGLCLFRRVYSSGTLVRRSQTIGAVCRLVF